MVSYVIKEVITTVVEVRRYFRAGSLVCSYLMIIYPVLKSELSATPLLKNWNGLSCLLRWCYTFLTVICLSSYTGTSPSCWMYSNFWEGFNWDGIWLMGAAGFLFVMWECLEHVTEHECARVGCTSPMKDVHVISV